MMGAQRLAPGWLLSAYTTPAHLHAEVAILPALHGVGKLLHVIVLRHQPRRQEVLERVDGVDEWARHVEPLTRPAVARGNR